jgi:DNA-binding transcriptional ArsR family regulator
MTLENWLNENGYRTVKNVELGGKIPDLIAYNDKEIVAFEEKKHAEEFQNAIGQCLHYLEESNKVFIVLPSKEMSKIPEKTLEVIKKHGIGLLFANKEISKVIDAKYFENSKNKALEKIKKREESLKEKPKRVIRFSGVTEKDIVKVLEKYPNGTKISNIAKILKASRQTVSKYVYALKTAGLVGYREEGRSKVCSLLKAGRERRKGIAALMISLMILLALPSAFAQMQSHPLSEITPIDINLNMTNETGSVFNVTDVGWLTYSGGIVFAGTRGISTLDIQDLAVTTSKIANNAVTVEKLSNPLAGNVNITGIYYAGSSGIQITNATGYLRTAVLDTAVLTSPMNSNLNMGSYSLTNATWVNSTNVNTTVICLNNNCVTSLPGAGAVTGSGIVNYVPLWNESSTINSSVIVQSGGNIGIGTISPARLLHVSGGNLTISNDTSPRSDIYWDSTNNRLVIRVN